MLENKMECYSRERMTGFMNYAKQELAGQEVMLVVGSKKIPFLNELNQEQELMKYLVVYIIMGLSLLNKGGSLVLRTYDLNIPFSCGLLFILHKYFDQLTIMKPLASNLHSAVSRARNV
jgi:hypothetical protein